MVVKADLKGQPTYSLVKNKLRKEQDALVSEEYNLDELDSLIVSYTKDVQTLNDRLIVLNELKTKYNELKSGDVIKTINSI